MNAIPCAKRELDIYCISDTPKVADEERVRALMRRAVSDGATIKGSTILWDLASKCEDPKTVTVSGRLARNVAEAMGPDYKSRVLENHGDTSWSALELQVRCRRCPPCRHYRRWLWATRAREEIAASNRTWFGTLTLRQEEHFLALLRARKRATDRGVDWGTLSEEEKFVRHVNVISPEITKWLKRVRKQSGSSLRYLICSEAHKSGYPHYHLLIHERGPIPVRHAVLAAQWSLGYTNFKLADSTAANYVTKYLTKGLNLARIRASVGYGKTALAIAFPEGKSVIL